MVVEGTSRRCVIDCVHCCQTGFQQQKPVLASSPFLPPSGENKWERPVFIVIGFCASLFFALISQVDVYFLSLSSRPVLPGLYLGQELPTQLQYSMSCTLFGDWPTFTFCLWDFLVQCQLEFPKNLSHLRTTELSYTDLSPPPSREAVVAILYLSRLPRLFLSKS